MDKKARLRGQQLAHVSRLSSMEEMASGLAHEISQPLAAIVNYTQGCVRYLQTEQHDATQLLEIMRKAVIQAERAEDAGALARVATRRARRREPRRRRRRREQ